MTRAPQALALKSIRPTVLAGSHAFSRGGMGPLRKIATLAVAATLAALCGAVVARAEVQVSCTADHVVVRTKGATLAEILAGLEATCRTRIELNGATSRQFIGVYSGSLRDVLSRLLVGVDHIVHSAAGHITIAIDPQNAAYPHAIAAFPDNDGGSSVQGWVPSVSQIASAATTPRAQAAQPDATTDDAEKETSEVQGWVPSARLVVSSIVPAIAAAASGVTAADVEGEPFGIQGWVPAQAAALPHPPTVTAAAPVSGALQPLPNDSDGGADGSVQGWMPTAVRSN